MDFGKKKSNVEQYGALAVALILTEKRQCPNNVMANRIVNLKLATTFLDVIPQTSENMLSTHIGVTAQTNTMSCQVICIMHITISHLYDTSHSIHI